MNAVIGTRVGVGVRVDVDVAVGRTGVGVRVVVGVGGLAVGVGGKDVADGCNGVGDGGSGVAADTDAHPTKNIRSNSIAIIRCEELQRFILYSFSVSAVSVLRVRTSDEQAAWRRTLKHHPTADESKAHSIYQPLRRCRGACVS